MFKPKELIGLGITAGVLYLLVSRDLVKLWQAGVDRNAEVIDAVNPASEGNLLFRWTTDLYRQLTGSAGTPGGDFYDWIHGRPDADPAPVAAPAVLPDTDDPEYIDSWRTHQGIL